MKSVDGTNEVLWEANRRNTTPNWCYIVKATFPELRQICPEVRVIVTNGLPSHRRYATAKCRLRLPGTIGKNPRGCPTKMATQ